MTKLRPAACHHFCVPVNTVARKWRVFVCVFLAVTSFLFAEESCNRASEACGAKSSEVWIDADYLLWCIKKNPVSVPLLTTASLSDAIPGAIGQPGTHTLLGHTKMNMGWMNGFHVGLGSSITPDFGVEASYFLLPRVSKTRSLSTSGEPGSQNFAVPVFDVTGVLGLDGIPGESEFILPGPIFGPGFFGRFKLRVSSRLQGAEIQGLYSAIQEDRWKLDGLGGFRWFQLHESLSFKANSGSVPNYPFGAGFFNFSDQFITANNFLAAQLGINASYLTGKWRFNGMLKGALGAMLEQIKIRGASSTSGGNVFFLTQGTANENLPGGIFAEPSNIWTHKKTTFAGAFEAKVCSGYRITRHLEVNLGYTFLWISKLLRPGDQIDRKINSTLTALADASRATVGTGPGPIPFGTPGPAPSPRGPKRPKALFKTTTFWAQGFDVGITWNF